MILVDTSEKVLRLGLSDISATRKSLARLLRAYYRDEIKDSKFRLLLSGFSGYVTALKSEAEIKEFREIADQVAELKERMQK